jgi:hypothetical protein
MAYTLYTFSAENLPANHAMMLTIPFVTVASFRAHPTYLDTNNLRSGSSVQADQDAELFNCLLMASAQVENFCNQPIQAHIQTDYDRSFVDRHGRLKHKAEHGPVRLLQSYTYATSLTQVTSTSSPQFRVENDGTGVPSRTALDATLVRIAASATGCATIGAALGSIFGPREVEIGAALGGFVGLIASLIDSVKSAQR